MTAALSHVQPRQRHDTKYRFTLWDVKFHSWLLSFRPVKNIGKRSSAKEAGIFKCTKDKKINITSSILLANWIGNYFQIIQCIISCGLFLCIFMKKSCSCPPRFANFDGSPNSFLALASNLFVQNVDLFVQNVFFVLSEASILPRKLIIINKRKNIVLMAQDQYQSVSLQNFSDFIFHTQECLYEYFIKWKYQK